MNGSPHPGGDGGVGSGAPAPRDPGATRLASLGDAWFAALVVITCLGSGGGPGRIEAWPDGAVVLATLSVLALYWNLHRRACAGARDTELGALLTMGYWLALTGLPMVVPRLASRFQAGTHVQLFGHLLVVAGVFRLGLLFLHGGSPGRARTSAVTWLSSLVILGGTFVVASDPWLGTGIVLAGAALNVVPDLPRGPGG